MWMMLLLGCGPTEAPRSWVHFQVEPGATALAGAEPLFRRSEAALRSDAGGTLPELWTWHRIEVPAPTAPAFAAALEAELDVRTAFVAPTPELPAIVGRNDDSCPVRTPSYAPYQGYLSVAPAGIDAPAAWSRAGGRGQGMWFADIEGGWNADHEDLPGDRMEHVAGRPIQDRGWIAHGTAVLGEVAARDNNLGMVGIAPDVERIFTTSIGNLPTAAAIDLAQSRLRPGDVLLIELHAPGPRGRFVPMEYWDDVWDAIKVATARGIVVVEAAGNGAEDLDHPAYAGKLTRSKERDSGAILVGAGAPARDGWVDRSRLDFSNYGSRVDVQGWGRRVASLDYGDLQACSAEAERDYTDQFAGTSSASPIVAGAALLLQGTQRAKTGHPLTPQALRALLAETGSPQTDGPSGPRTQHIGPRPNLARALDFLDRSER